MKIKSSTPIYYFLIALFLFNCYSVYAEFKPEKFVVKDPDGKEKVYELNMPADAKDGKAYLPKVTHFVKADTILGSFVKDHNARKNYIVVFDLPPVKTAKYYNKKGIKDYKSKILKQIEEFEALKHVFLNDIREIERKHRNADPDTYMTAEIETGGFWRIAISGAKITTREWMIKHLEQLPYIKFIEEEVEVKAFDDTTNELIKADSVWSELESTGDGVLIAIIDTGIDSSHTELDNGKVIGGYDFVNNDDDPYDDHYHGTHCAGIAAANGSTLQGVAPDADLMAVKVLNASGSGYSSWIINGIEYAVDPDEDPMTDDGADIISMSLGGPGNPDDAMSEAVDNAVDNGVFTTISAGNSGSNNYTIGSPGCARKVITIGASDNNDNIASFSSRGPNLLTYGIKPDITAPGVSVYSSMPNNQYSYKSGTSMSCPHVAGAAALLLELDPDLEPEEIKAAFIHSAEDISANLWEQGAGRLDVYNATFVESAFIPQSISFGVVDLTVDVWTKPDTVMLRNLGDEDKTYVLSVEGTLPDSLTFSIEPDTVDINAGDETQIVITARCVNDDVPNPDGTIPTYEAKLVAASDYDEIKSPIAVIKSPMIDFSFDASVYFLLVHNNDDIYNFIFNPGTEYQMLLPPDTYDVILEFQSDEMVVREDLILEDVLEVNINRSDAENYIGFAMYNPDGYQLYFNRGVVQFIESESGYGTYSAGGHPSLVEISDVSDNYLYEGVPFYYTYSQTRDYYMTPWAISEGINGNISISNDHEDYKQMNYSYDLDDGITQIFYKEYISQGWGYSFTNYSTDLTSQNRIESPFQRRIFVTPIPYDDFGLTYFAEEIHNTSGDANPTSANLLYKGSYNKCTYPDTLRTYCFDWENEQFMSTESNLDINVGHSAPAWIAGFDNLFFQIKLSGKPTYAYRYFTDQYGNVKMNTVTSYSVFDGSDVPVETGTLINRDNYSYFDMISVSPGDYEIEFYYDQYNINGNQGLATVRAEFDLYGSDNDPPYLESFMILSDGLPAEILESSATNYVTFVAADDNQISTAELYYQPNNGSSWTEISLSNSGDVYTGDIPSSLENGLYSLKLTLTDNSNNPLIFTLDPAFEHQAPIESPSLVNPDNQTEITQRNTVLSWTEVSDADYELVVARDMYFDDTFLNASDITATSNNVNELEHDQTYYWRVKAKVNDNESDWSQSWSFTVDTNACPFENQPNITQIEDGENKLFKAINNIIVPKQGNGQFNIFGNGSTGATANFVAAESIKFEPGFHAQKGSSVRAYIHTSPCNQGSPRIVIDYIQSEEVKDEKPINIDIFPNPNDGVFTVSSSRRSAEIEISDLLGRIVYRGSFGSSQTKVIDINKEPKGVYFLRITADSETVIKKVVTR